MIVQGAEALAVFAHMAPGTASVTAGQAVWVGEVLGRVGHTGGSTAPHLHFHFMDSANPVQRRVSLHLRGVPRATCFLLAQMPIRHNMSICIATGAALSSLWLIKGFIPSRLR